MKSLRLAFDIDNTLVEGGTKEHDYLDAKPIAEMIDLVNMLYDEGHEIFLFTSRATFYGQLKQEDWLRNKMGIKFHYAYFGKPYFDLFVDDRAIDWYDGFTKFNVQTLLDRIQTRQQEEH